MLFSEIIMGVRSKVDSSSCVSGVLGGCANDVVAKDEVTVCVDEESVGSDVACRIWLNKLHRTRAYVHTQKYV